MEQDPVQKPYAAPAVEFELATGLSGISRQWVMPYGKSYAETQTTFSTAYSRYQELKKEGIRDVQTERQIRAAYDSLTALNPDLKKFDAWSNDTQKIGDVVYGAISQFNLSDIEHFGLTTRQQRLQDVELLRIENTIAIRADASIGWCPSKETLIYVARQMNVHPNYKDWGVEQIDALETFKLGSLYVLQPEQKAKYGPLRQRRPSPTFQR